ncbi:MAG: hypothetical protein IKR85_05225 [Clostridia bacterium]|nr:hypothetical protein [Clostridia bacterium]
MKQKSTANLVAFERGSEYFYRRAVINLVEGNIEDALRLIKHGLRGNKKIGEALLDASLIASQAGLTQQASAYITRALAEGCPDDKLLYALASVLSARGDAFASTNALNALYAMDTSGEFTLRTLDELSQYLRTGISGATPRMERAHIRLRRASDLVLKGQSEEAFREFEKCLKSAEKSPLANALYALALTKDASKKAKAVTHIEQALGHLHDDVPNGMRALCIAAQACINAGMNADDTYNMLRLLTPPEIHDEDALVYIQTLAVIGRADAVYAFARDKLSKNGFNPLLCHALSVSACALGMSRSEVMRGWRRILKADEHNLICREFIKAYDGGQLLCAPEDYEFRLTSEMCLSLLMRLNELLGKPEEEKRKSETRELLAALVFSTDRSLQSAALSVLGSIDTPEARQLTDMLIFRPELPQEARDCCIRMLAPERITAARKKYAVLVKANAPSPDVLIRSQSPWVKRLYMNALEYVAKSGEFHLHEALMQNMLRALSDRSLRKACLRDVAAAEAGLVYITLRNTGKHINKNRLLRDYEISARRLSRMLKLIRTRCSGTDRTESD